MEHRLSNFKVFVEKDYESMSAKAADVFAAAIAAKPDGGFGFATGGTPVGVYQELIKKVKAGKLSFAKMTTFNLDEYYPISRSMEQSYYRFMRDELFDHVDVDMSRVHVPNGEAKDPEAECAAYEKALADFGYVELQLLGIGRDGHIGFNEPNDYFPAKTNYIKLDASTIDANARFFDSKEQVPTAALTMGIQSIMMAKEILLIANGANKAHMIKEMIFGNINPRVQASVLQLHRNVTVVLDEEAAAEII